MIYGTAFDALTKRSGRFSVVPAYLPGNRLNLGYAGTNLYTTTQWRSSHPRGAVDTVEIPLAAGIDAQGVPWIKWGNTYFYTVAEILNFYTTSDVPATDPGLKTAEAMLKNAYSAAARTRNVTLDMIIGQLKAAGVPVTYYQAPLAPSAPVPAPSPSVPTVPSGTISPPSTSAPLPQGQPPVVVSNIPPGFILLLNDPVRAYPIYSGPPVVSGGVTTLGGSAYTSLLIEGPLRGGATNTSLNLDPIKFHAGAYYYRETDLGGILSPAGRTYELYKLEIFDSVTGNITTLYETTEGGGGGIHFADAAPTILRVAADLTTMGQTEIFHATNEDVAKKVDAVVGGGAIAVGAAAITGGTSLGVMGTVGAAGAGIVSGAVSKDAESVITNSLISGAAIGIVANVYSPGGSPTSGESLPGQVQAPIGPEAPQTAFIGPSPDVAVPVAPTATVTPGGSVITQATSYVTKAVATTAVGAGTSALAVGLKQLTGQGADAGADNAYSLMGPTLGPELPPTAPAPAISGKTLLALGAVGLLAFIKTRHA